MAYVPRQIPQDEENQFANQSPTTPYPVAPQGGGSAGAGTEGTGAAPGVGTSTQFGSNAAKLSDYLKANQDQVGEFGNKLAGDLTQGYNQTKGSIDTGFGDFNQSVNQGYAQNNPDLVSKAASNPSDFVKNSDNVSQFKSLYNDQYSGPKNFESSEPYANINSNVNKAVENASLVNAPSGLSTYLTNAGYESNATPGMKTLDAALLSGNKDAQKAIKTAASPYGTLGDYLSGKAKEANTNAGTAQTQADQIRQQVQNQFTGQGGVIPTLQSDLTSRLSSTKNTQSAFADKAIRDFQSGNVTPDELKALGFNSSDMNSSALASAAPKYAGILKNDYNAPPDWGSLFTKQNPDAVYGSPGSVATPDEIAKAQALTQLTGQDMTSFLGSTQAAGPLIQQNTQGLKDLSANVNQRDQDTVMNAVSSSGGYFAGKPVSSFEQLVPLMMSNPSQVQKMLDGMKGSKNYATFQNALNRMGLTPSAPPPTTGTGGGYYSAS